MATPFQLDAFTAHNLSVMAGQARRDELTRLGLRHIKRQRAMRWDGRDQHRAHSLAVRKYNRVIREIERVGCELRAKWSVA